MAIRYVRSTDGSDADGGTTWALAKATLTGVAAIDTVGDEIWVSQSHAESTAAAITFDWAGTAASPTHVMCGNDAAEPPTALATTASVTTTGNSAINISSGADFLYVYGINFHSGSGAVGAASINGDSTAAMRVFENCNFDLATTDASSRIALSNVFQGYTEIRNCGFQFSSASQGLTFDGWVHIIGGSILADTAITLFAATVTNIPNYLIDGFDFTNAAATLNIGASTAANIRVTLRNCKMPASWSGSVNSSTPGQGSVWELYNCDSADTNYRLEKKTQFGSVTHETTDIRTGGATDGTTGISWKMVSNADSEWNHQTLDSPEIVQWNETTGSAITATIEILHDSLTNVTDRNVWIDVQYLGTSGRPLSLFINDAAANYITTAADQTASSATWTTTGLTNPNKQKLNVTFTPQEKGFIHATVRLALASKTVYVDPLITIT